ncbi:MAG: flavodoxin family protein [Pseudomonadota bacterium]
MQEDDTNRRLLIVWHSRTGASEQMARAAADAARAEIAVDCLKADAVDPAIMLAASAYLFVCPENLGTMSGAMKEFFDTHYYPVLGRIEGRAYATIIAAGSDGTGTQRQLDRIATGWRLKRVVDPCIVGFDAQTPEAILAEKSVSEADLNRCRELGAALGTGAALGVF